MGRKKRRGLKPVKQKRVTDATRDLTWIREQAQEYGLLVTVSQVKTRRAEIPHWSFRKFAVVVLNYWPSNGRYWIPGGNRKGKVSEPQDALNLAIGETFEGTELEKGLTQALRFDRA